MEKRRILIVDNDPDVSGLLRDFLEASGFATQRAVDGVNGLAVLAQAEAEQQPVDLIILDLRMPTLDGRSFLERLAHESDSHPPVIVVSGHVSETDRRYLDEHAHIRGVFEKPFDLLELDKTARQLFDESPPADEGLWAM